jgi:hypothetical protein
MSDQEDLELDSQLDRLASDTSLADRKEVLQSFVKYWRGTIKSGDGFSAAELDGIQMPEVLKWWYVWAGRRKEILGGNNNLLSPNRLSLKDGLLCFYGENQWVYEWATSASGEDSPVFGRFTGMGSWQPQNMRLSEHLILACLFEGIMYAKYTASAAWLPEKELWWIAERVPPVPISPWGWFTAQFYARRGAFVVSMENGVVDGSLGYSVWVGAKKRGPLDFLRAIIDNGWELVDL